MSTIRMAPNDRTSDALLPGNRVTDENAQNTMRMAKTQPSESEQDYHIPIRNTHTYPLLQGMAHATSVVVAAAILALCFTNTYFQDLTTPNINSILNAFQFVARFHELLVGASLTAVVTYYLRSFLVAEQGLPLGYVTSAFQLSSPQSLFSKEFWAATTSYTSTRRYWFGGLVLLSVAIAALIGPSSAILIIPQLDWWPIKNDIAFSGTGGFSWVNSSYESVWPTVVDASLINKNCSVLALGTNRACPYTNMVNVQNWVNDYMADFAAPNFTVTEDSGASKYLTASKEPRNNGYSIASADMSFLSRSLANLWLYGINSHFEYANVGRPMITAEPYDDRSLLKPVMQVQCSRPQDISNGDNITMTFNTSSLLFKTGGKINNISRVINATDFQSEDSHIRFGWVDLRADSKNLTLGALIAATFNNPEKLFPSSEGNSTRALYACVVKPYWVPTTMSWDPTTTKTLISNDQDLHNITTNQDLMRMARDLIIDPSFADYLNADISGEYFKNVMEFELSRFSFHAPFFDGNWGTDWQWLFATTISLQLTDAISRISHNQSIYVFNQTTNSGNEASKKNIKFLNDIYHSVDAVPKDYPNMIRNNPEEYFPIQWKFEQFGYAWGFDRITKVLASIVLLTHVAVVFVHFGIVWRKKLRFDSWEGLADFMTLAMQSPPSTILKSASAYSKDSIYAEPVYIRESDNGCSAILAMDEDSKEGLRNRLTVGEKYQ
ncbi:MAG: hypothetical protein Q9227_005674 [Pyrenula ochraceoflavens]